MSSPKGHFWAFTLQEVLLLTWDEIIGSLGTLQSKSNGISYCLWDWSFGCTPIITKLSSLFLCVFFLPSAKEKEKKPFGLKWKPRLIYLWWMSSLNCSLKMIFSPIRNIGWSAWKKKKKPDRNDVEECYISEILCWRKNGGLISSNSNLVGHGFYE